MISRHEDLAPADTLDRSSGGAQIAYKLNSLDEGWSKVLLREPDYKTQKHLHKLGRSMKEGCQHFQVFRSHHVILQAD